MYASETSEICILHWVNNLVVSGKLHPLMPIVKSLFNHICDVVWDVPIFQAEYGIILRQLLVIKEYRVHMKKQVYCSKLIILIGNYLHSHFLYSWVNFSLIFSLLGPRSGSFVHQQGGGNGWREGQHGIKHQRRKLSLGSYFSLFAGKFTRRFPKSP